jgi:hypothetical protein
VKNHAKRAIKHLEALGFVRDETASNPRKGKFVYRHANQPDRPVKVFAGETDTTSISVMRLADQIAGTGHRGPTLPSTIKERARIKKSAEKARREADERARAERSELAEREWQARLAADQSQRHQRDIESLMRPGYGR